MVRLGALALLALLPLAAQQGDTVRVPAGSFEMGRAHELPDDGLKWVPHTLRDDRPVHTVSLAAFEIQVHEVTNKMYAEFIEEGGSPFKAPYYWPGGKPPNGKEDDPVANITWAEADAYCRWCGMRLPTEAEWERACRGGLESQKYPWGDADADETKAHFDSVKGPNKVCSYETNGYGLCDMAGNVWEWTADLYSRNYYRETPLENPTGATEGRYRVLRGGSWADVPKFLTCAHRSFSRPEERSPNMGFRCVRRIPPGGAVPVADP